MIKFFKKHFIPGEHNNHQPHLLRRKSIFFILKFVLILEFLFLIQMVWVVPFTNFFSAILPNVLIDLTNNDRADNKVPELAVNPLLQQAAQNKANDMAEKAYFSHTSPNGKTPWKWLDEVGYKYSAAGENLAMNFSDSEDIVEAWMKSAGHRKNILNRYFTEIGIAAAKGYYKDGESIFVVQYFGRPRGLKGGKVVSADEIMEEGLNQGAAVLGEEIFITTEDETELEEVAPIDVEAKSSLFAKIFVMPKTILAYLYYFIAIIVLLALILKIFVKPKIQYPKLIFNGVILLFVLISILYFNVLIAGSGMIL